MANDAKYVPSPAVAALEKKYFTRTTDEQGFQRRMYQMQLDLLELYKGEHEPDDKRRATMTRRFLKAEIAKLEPLTMEDVVKKQRANAVAV